MNRLVTMLSIAATDPMGGAGVAADIKTGASLGVHVITAVTAVTLQNSRQMGGVVPVAPQILKGQLEYILEDASPEAVKIGMAGNPENLKIISDFLDELPKDTPVVVDPVMKASVEETRPSQFGEDMREIYLHEIFPKAYVVTPNLEELKMLTGSDEINSQTLEKLNSRAAVVKGGHCEGPYAEDTLLMYDLNYSLRVDNCDFSGKGKTLSTITKRNKKLDCRNLHGTGCVFSSLLACNLAMGFDLINAFQKANEYLNKIINKSSDYQLGNSLYGPLNINQNFIKK